MKIFLNLFAATIISISIHAQDFQIKKQETENTKTAMMKRPFGMELLGSDDNFVYYVFIPHHKVFGNSQGYTTAHYVSKVSKDLKTQLKKTIDFGKSENWGVQKIIYLNNNIYAIKRDDKIINAYKIDKSSLQVSKTPNKIMDYMHEGFYRKNYSFAISEDQSKLMIFYFIYGKEKSPERFGFRVFDANLELLWENNNFKPEFEEGNYSFENFTVNNEGEVSFIGKISPVDDKTKFRTDGNSSQTITYKIDNPNGKFQLYHLSEKGVKIKTLDLNLNKYTIRDLNYSVNHNILSIYGVYCTREKVSAIGTFIAQVNFENKSVDNINYKRFSKELISRDYNKKEMTFFNKHYNKTEWDGFHYKISKLRTRNNGSKYFISEKWIKGQYSDVNFSMTAYLYEDMYITSIDTNQEITTNFKISKRQYTRLYINRCSYAIMEGENGSYFIFNSSPVPTSKMLKEGATKILQLSRKGQTTVKIIEPKFESNSTVFLSPAFVQISNNEFIYGRISFEPKYNSYVKVTLVE
ncbi:MAG: hypothetical protein KAG64_07000 [Bacteroidales bacterium]|nr:hypothetical protein [Bacteroidales bacterium]